MTTRMTRPANQFGVSMRQKLFLIAIMTVFVSVTHADAPATQPVHKERISYTLPELFKRVPPLKHDATGRLPLIAILPFRLSEKDDSYEHRKPWQDEVYRELGRRGLTQMIPPHEPYIPVALAMQKAGLKVV